MSRVTLVFAFAHKKCVALFYVVIILIKEHHMPFVERFMAREVRCWVTDRQTDTHNNYSYPRGTCVPRVNQGAPHALCCSCVNIENM